MKMLAQRRAPPGLAATVLAIGGVCPYSLPCVRCVPWFRFASRIRSDGEDLGCRSNNSPRGLRRPGQIGLRRGDWPGPGPRGSGSRPTRGRPGRSPAAESVVPDGLAMASSSSSPPPDPPARLPPVGRMMSVELRPADGRGGQDGDRRPGSCVCGGKPAAAPFRSVPVSVPGCDPVSTLDVRQDDHAQIVNDRSTPDRFRSRATLASGERGSGPFIHGERPHRPPGEAFDPPSIQLD
jgi:hypothetical protein